MFACKFIANYNLVPRNRKQNELKMFRRKISQILWSTEFLIFDTLKKVLQKLKLELLRNKRK